MKLSPARLVTLAGVSLCALFLLPAPAQAQIEHLPALGSPAPASLITADKHTKECRTGPNHRDPCTEIAIGKIKYVVAWDAQTKNITYIFTDSRELVTDSGLSVGGTCRVGGTDDAGTISYMKWLIDPRWKGVDPKAGDDAVWYAALHKNDFDPHYGDIVGFVRSSYIDLKK
jgi:hypothetical protein